jgi:hypothetical protein
MRKLIIITLAAFILLVASCDLGYLFTGIYPLSDSRFDGTFRAYSHWDDPDSDNEITVDTRYIFNGTNKAEKYYFYQRYQSGEWVSYSGDYPGDSVTFDMEVNIDGGVLRMKIWGYDDGEWSEMNPYSFDDSGEVLTLIDYYSEGVHLVLDKVI